MIELQGVSKWYGPVIGVSNLSIALGPGVTGFLGPNGAGKSTLLNLLTGQLKTSRGTITIDGEPPWNNAPLMRRIGVCPEQDAFWRMQTGRDFVFALTRLHGFTAEEARQRTDRVLDQVGMTERAGKRIAGMSKGMRQRIKLAQALAHEPDHLFLDEPLNGMDPVGRKETIELIRKLGGEGKTIIVSSHILREVEAMTNTILLMHHGRQLAHGNIHEIRELIDSHPLQVTLRCDRVEALTSLLVRYDDVLGVQFNRIKGELTVETNRPQEFHERLPGLLKEEGIEVHSLWSPDDNLQAVFDYLVR